MTPPVIHTARLCLRPVTAADRLALCAIANDPDVARFLLSMPHPYTAADADAFVARVQGKPVWMIEDADGPAGIVAHGGELGYWLARRVWGRGYAAEAARAVLGHYFWHRRDAAMASGHAVENDRSGAVLRKLGFVYTGVQTRRHALCLGADVTLRAMELSHAAWCAGFEVTSPRLTLRSMTAADAPALRRIVTIPDVGRMLFLFPPDWTDAAAAAFIDKTRFRGALPFRLGIYHQGRLVGSVGVHVGDAPDIFYFLDPAVQGQGFGREALIAFFRALFGQFGLTALTADAFDDNPASQHILRSVGFAEAGRGMGTSAARVEPAPITLYRLTRHDFEAAT